MYIKTTPTSDEYGVAVDLTADRDEVVGARIGAKEAERERAGELVVRLERFGEHLGVGYLRAAARCRGESRILVSHALCRAVEPRLRRRGVLLGLTVA